MVSDIVHQTRRTIKNTKTSRIAQYHQNKSTTLLLGWVTASEHHNDSDDDALEYNDEYECMEAKDEAVDEENVDIQNSYFFQNI